MTSSSGSAGLHTLADASSYLDEAKKLNQQSQELNKEQQKLVDRAFAILQGSHPQAWEKVAEAAGIKVSNDPKPTTTNETLVKSSTISNDTSSGASTVDSENPQHLTDTATSTPGEQSQVDRENNYHNQATLVTDKLNNGEAPTKAEAAKMQAAGQRAHGDTKPGGVAAQAQSAAATKAFMPIRTKDREGKGRLPSGEQSRKDREQNFQTEAAVMKEKLQHHEHISKQEADHLQHLEARFRGFTEKGGVTSQAQRAADKEAHAATASLTEGENVKTAPLQQETSNIKRHSRNCSGDFPVPQVGNEVTAWVDIN